MPQPNVLGDLELGFTYRNSTPGTSAKVATPANYASVAAIDTRLKAISATVYTDYYLSKMLVNDKIAAVRAADDANTI